MRFVTISAVIVAVIAVILFWRADSVLMGDDVGIVWESQGDELMVYGGVSVRDDIVISEDALIDGVDVSKFATDTETKLRNLSSSLDGVISGQEVSGDGAASCSSTTAICSQYLPLTGGKLTGAITGTTAKFNTITADLVGNVTGTATGLSGNPSLTLTGLTMPTGAASGYVLQADGLGKANWSSSLSDLNSAYLAHTHDSRYYTETETDTLLGNYLPLVGGTLTGNLTGTQATFFSIAGSLVGSVTGNVSGTASGLSGSPTVTLSGLTLPAGAGSGYFLTSDAAGVSSWLNLSASLLPVGTEGQTLYNNAGTWTANSGIFYDDVDSRVGIGTVSPMQALDVVGRVRGGGFVVSGESGTFGDTSASVEDWDATIEAWSVVDGLITAPTGYDFIAGGFNVGEGIDYYFQTGVSEIYGKSTVLSVTASTLQMADTTVDFSISYGSARGVGLYSFVASTGEQFNNYYGYEALKSNTVGASNVAIGYKSLYSNISGNSNIALGREALYLNTAGLRNIAIGQSALSTIVAGNSNIAIGTNALKVNTSSLNIAIGEDALVANTSGSGNQALGSTSLSMNTSGYANAAIGNSALMRNTTGYENIAMGTNSAVWNSTGYRNVMLGYSAGSIQANGSTALQTPNNSIYIGYNAMGFNDSDSNTIVIGASAKGVGANSVVLGNDNILKTVLKGSVGIGDTSPDYLLELYDATNTPALALSDDDIAHGLTTLAETDVFSHLSSLSTTAGGVQWTAISDTDAQALFVRGVIGSTDPTDATSAIKFIGAKSNGTTGMADLGSSETVFQVANNDDTAALTILGSGNIGIGTAGPGQALEVNGGIRQNTVTAKPTCDSSARGTTWFVQGGAGVKDTYEVCAKDVGDAYSWRTIY